MEEDGEDEKCQSRKTLSQARRFFQNYGSISLFMLLAAAVYFAEPPGYLASLRALPCPPQPGVVQPSERPTASVARAFCGSSTGRAPLVASAWAKIWQKAVRVDLLNSSSQALAGPPPVTAVLLKQPIASAYNPPSPLPLHAWEASAG